VLSLKVEEDRSLRPGHPLKLNSYDLGVDIELADALTRLRFSHPEVRAVVIGSARDRVFCSGANIYMLGSSTHSFKVNFCKYTNETRLALEDASACSGLKSVAAVSGACAGGGYELAMACDRILLVDDHSSTVSLPEVPLLAVLPGTGGLTRLVDKRHVARDKADAFATLGEGVKGTRAKDWGLVDEVVPASRFAARVREAALALAATGQPRDGAGVSLPPLAVESTPETARYRYVTVDFDRRARVARLLTRGPDAGEPQSAADMRERGAAMWALQAFRELDDALLDLRFNAPEIGLLVLETSGETERVLAADHALWDARHDWFAREVLLHMKRVLKRLDQTARSLFAVVGRGSCFAGSLFELALAADRTYMLDAEDGPRIALSPLNRGVLPGASGLSRLAMRFWGRTPPATPDDELVGAADAATLGLVTFAPDDIDWEDELRVAVEERAALSPDALTGMEASLRFVGPETMETKIFGRLSAWQNWIFQRPNAVGPQGALTLYGQPTRPKFDWNRT
jgi:benzoyl-CoA-dihydrodiol lyase